MPYGKLLYNTMMEKNISITKLADKLGKDYSYISKIVNGRVNPPSDKINIEISKILEIDERELKVEAYFDKAPKEIKDMIYTIVKSILVLINSIVVNNKETFLTITTNEEFNEMLKRIENEPIARVVISILDNKNTIIKNSNEVGEIISIEDIDEFGFSSILKLTQPFTTIISDNGMYPRIPLNANVKVEIKDNYIDGDIVCITGENGVIARQLVINGEYYTFIPYNNEYKIQTFTKEDAEKKIFAKAVAVIINL